MWSFRAFIATLVAAAFLAVPFYFYWNFLTRGMEPPVGVKVLDQFEKDGVPDFTLPDMNGAQVALSQFRGKLVLLNLWATWCAPCVKEFPSLKNLAEKYKDRIVVVAVSHDGNKEDIESFIKTFGGVPESFVLLWDKDKTTGKLLGSEALPETYILGKDLKLIRKVAGETAWDSPMTFRFFEELLGP